MSGYVLLKDGWVTDTITGEINKDHYPDSQIIEVEETLILKIRQIQSLVYWDGGLYQVKDPKKIWQRLRGLGMYGQPCVTKIKTMLGIDLFPDIPSEVDIGEPLWIPKKYTPAFEDIKSGLRLELSNESEIDMWVDAMVKSGFYSKEDALLDAYTWLSDPLSWGIKTVWNDKILQLEFHHFNPNDKSVYGGFLTHVERRLPMWFWAQMSKPLYKEFKRFGFQYNYANVKSERRDWVENIKTTYGTEEIEEKNNHILIRNSVQNVLDHIGKWPEHRTIQNWRFEKDNYLIREMTDTDVSENLMFLEKSWGSSKRKELAIKAFEQDKALCNPTFLITIYNNSIMGCVEIREKNKDTASLLFMHKPTYEKHIGEISMGAIAKWCKGVGYKKISVSIEERLYDRLKDVWEGHGFKFVNKGFDIVFFERDVEGLIDAYC